MIILSFYFFPGTIFRLLKAPIFEFIFKISPFLIIRFIKIILLKNPRKIIFSHHSIFYLALFCSYGKRIFLVHDLMYVRGKSRGASRRAQRFYFFIELNLYRFAPVLLVQSYHEWRLLQRFLNQKIYLISCCNLNLNPRLIERQLSIAVISDWRREENIHGATHFFSSIDAKKYNGNELTFHFFGFNSKSLVNQLSSQGISPKINIINKGTFNKVSDITANYFFVPIYHGAGIKRKTLEALCAGRVVIGTKAAFIGLPYWMISKVIYRVKSISDLQKLPDFPSEHNFYVTLKELSHNFREIGEIKDLW